MNTTRRPSSGFAGHLGYAFPRAVRRRERFAARIPARGWVFPKRGWAAAAVVFLAAVCVGRGATYAATGKLGPRTADLVLARAEAQLEFANARLRLATDISRDVEVLSVGGRTSPFERENAQIELSRIQADASARALDVEETRISGLEPNHTLSAPLVGGRDFVTERLRVQRKALAEQAALAERTAISEKELAAVGHDSQAVSGFNESFEVASATLPSLEDQLILRQDFLAGKLAPRKVELEQTRLELKAKREAGVPRLDRAEKKLDLARQLAEVGRATPFEARQVEIEYREAALELKLIELDTQIIERKLAALPEEQILDSNNESDNDAIRTPD